MANYFNNLDSILKSRDITLQTKVCLVKAIVFTGVMYGCESWTIKNGEFWRIVFNLWYWRRLFRVPWTARKLNQSILRKSTLTIWRTDSEAEVPILWPSNANSQWKRHWRQEEKGVADEMVRWHHQLNGSEWTLANSKRQWRTEKPRMLQFMGL